MFGASLKNNNTWKVFLPFFVATKLWKVDERYEKNEKWKQDEAIGNHWELK